MPPVIMIKIKRSAVILGQKINQSALYFSKKYAIYVDNTLKIIRQIGPLISIARMAFYLVGDLSAQRLLATVRCIVNTLSRGSFSLC